jgi:hypothetical protein
MHVLMSNLSRLDARLNTPITPVGRRLGPYVNFFDADGTFLANAGRLPRYGPLFWPLFTEVLKGLGAFGRRMLAVENPEDIDEIMEESVEMYALHASTSAALY